MATTEMPKLQNRGREDGGAVPDPAPVLPMGSGWIPTRPGRAAGKGFAGGNQGNVRVCSATASARNALRLAAAVWLCGENTLSPDPGELGGVSVRTDGVT